MHSAGLLFLKDRPNKSNNMTTSGLPPIRPLNNFGGKLRPINNNFRGVRSISSQPRNAFNGLDINRIGKGHLMVEGSYNKQFGVEKYSGLKGQLMKLKTTGRRTVTKNLSLGNIEQMHDLIAGRLKKKVIGSQNYLNRRDKMAIMKESRKLVKTEGSNFTWQDREDLKKIVETARQQYKDKILHRDQTDNGARPSITKPPSPDLDDLSITPNNITKSETLSPPNRPTLQAEISIPKPK